MKIEEARAFLRSAGVFFENDDGDEPELEQTLNMNDVWCWASADGQYVPDDKLPEVAGLFLKYGWAGILYWVSEQNNGMSSEFLDNNRFIDFVRHEEQLRKDVPNSDQRAYKKITYVLGA